MKKPILLLLLVVALLAATMALADEPFRFSPQIEFYSEESSSSFGKHVNIGDFNGDNIADMIVSDPYHGEDDYGRVLIFLDIQHWDSGSYDMASTHADVEFTGGTNDILGNTTALCDFNGDGLNDLGVSRLGPTMYLFYGGDHWTSGIEVTDPESEADIILTNIGYIRCQDVNDDGYDDIFNGTELVLGDNFPSGTVIDLDVSPPALEFTSEVPNNIFRGRFLGDVNGDGHVDYIFHEQYYYGFEGAIRIWFGPDDYSTPMEIHYPDDPPDVIEEGTYWDAALYIRGIGDWNDDGADDILVNQKGSDDWRLTRLVLGETGMQSGHDLIDLFGVWSIISCNIGDLNGDGDPDLLYRDDSFYWDRKKFPQTGTWFREDYDPQGVHNSIGPDARTLTGHIDDDGIPDAVFYDYTEQEVEVWVSGGVGDDDDDTGPDDDDDDDDTGPDDDDNDTGPDDDDDDTGPDDDDDDNDDDDDDGCGC